MSHKIDVIGDIHGQYETLMKLGVYLGYDVENGWTHREGRVLVFLGDLIDRGDQSLEVAELVLSLVRSGRALCLMGNHEYNLVGYNLAIEKKKRSNEKTVIDLGARHQRWAPVLEFFRTLPLALDLPALRVIHAVWHQQHYAAVAEVLRVRPAMADPADPANTANDALEPTIEWLRRHVSLSTPFDAKGLQQGLPTTKPHGQEDLPHEILMKGHEERADATFLDSDGKEREFVRVTWWLKDDVHSSHDKVTVFGHYWNVPPTAGRLEETAPPHPSGHPRLLKWQSEHTRLVPLSGTAEILANAKAVCVDYNGVLIGGGGPCVGAYRWPEHQVAWVREPTTSTAT